MKTVEVPAALIQRVEIFIADAYVFLTLRNIYMYSNRVSMT
jgi:hypothetical protein